jgi:hypothetical protein
VSSLQNEDDAEDEGLGPQSFQIGDRLPVDDVILTIDAAMTARRT